MPLRATVLATVLACAGLVAGATPVAMAGCGGVATAQPAKKLGDFQAPLIIGDSVLLGAVEPVARQGYEINTRGCRQWSEGAGVVLKRKRRGTLPHMVAMFLGADFSVSTKQIRAVMYWLGHKRVLVLVTPREVGGAGGSDAQHMRDMAKRYPTRIFLLDWARYTRHKSSWFAPDGVHLGYPGISGLAHFVKRALKYAAPGAFPGPPPESPASA
jgi:hypothetical protein